ncbi:MAG: glycosyltransferase family 4 protein [Nitrospinae bacterium]|nr:glycosyltransferase family 4 protein [Nitrospinota bacterium]
MAILTNWYPPHIGGSAINIHKICREHAKRHEVTVLTPQRYGGPDEEEMEGIVVKRFQNRHNPARLYPDTNMHSLCPGLFLEILQGRYDLVIAYPALTPNFQLCLLATLLNRTPIILTVFDLLDYRRFSLSQFPCPTLLEKFYREKSLAKRWVFRLQLKCCKGILGIAQTEVDFIRRFNPLVSLTPVHVDLREFEEIQRGGFKKRYSLEGKKIVLSVGRIEHHKGQDILLGVVPEIIKHAPTAYFVFVGPVTEHGYFTSIQEMIKDLGVSEHVLFTGALTRTDVLQAFQDCDLHVAPVRFMNSGAVTQEAWAARKPAIQSNRVDPNHIEEGVDGYIFDLNDPQDLSDKILLLLGDEGLRQRLGETGRRKVAERFDYEKGILHLEALYDRVLAGKNGAHPSF